MTLHLRRAGLADVWQFLGARKSHPDAHEYSLIVAEVLADRVWAGFDDEMPLAVGGVMRLSPDLPGSAWLLVRPDAGRRTASLALMMRRVIAAEADGRGVVCAVRDDNQIGQRLARALGFTPTDRTLMQLRQWGIDGERGRDDHGEGGQAPGAHGRGGAAPAGG